MIVLDRCNAPADFLDILACIERGDAEVALTSSAKASTGSNDDLSFLEHLVEHAPGVDPFRALDPDVGSVFTTEDGEPCILTSFAQQCGIAHVVLDQRAYLCFALG